MFGAVVVRVLYRASGGALVRAVAYEIFVRRFLDHVIERLGVDCCLSLIGREKVCWLSFKCEKGSR